MFWCLALASLRCALAHAHAPAPRGVLGRRFAPALSPVIESLHLTGMHVRCNGSAVCCCLGVGNLTGPFRRFLFGLDSSGPKTPKPVLRSALHSAAQECCMALQHCAQG